MSLFSDKHMNKESPISPGTLRKQCTVRDINLGELLQTDKLKSQKSPGSCRGCTQGTSIEFNVPREPLQLCEQDGTKSIQSHAHSLKCVPKRKIQVLWSQIYSLPALTQCAVPGNLLIIETHNQAWETPSRAMKSFATGSIGYPGLVCIVWKTLGVWLQVQEILHTVIVCVLDGCLHFRSMSIKA